MKHLKTVNKAPMLIGHDNYPFNVYLFAVHAQGVALFAQIHTGYSRLL